MKKVILKRKTHKLKLFNSSWEDAFQKLRDQSFDLIITSPPYNIDKKYSGKFEDKNSRYVQYISCFLRQCANKLSPDGHLFLNLGITFKNQLQMFELFSNFKDIMQLYNIICWVKSIPISDDNTIGNFNPVNSNRFFSYTHEWIFHFSKSETFSLDKFSIGPKYVDPRNSKRRKGERSVERRDIGNTWLVPYQTRCKKFFHPCPFPEKLVENIFKLFPEGQIKRTLDPFAGSFTVARVSDSLKISNVSIELSESYFKTALSLF